MISTNLEVIWEMSVEAAEYTAMDVEKYRREFINRVVQARGKMKQREVAETGQSHLALYWFEVYEQGFEERVVPSGALEFAFHGAL